MRRRGLCSNTHQRGMVLNLQLEQRRSLPLESPWRDRVSHQNAKIHKKGEVKHLRREGVGAGHTTEETRGLLKGVERGVTGEAQIGIQEVIMILFVR